MSTCFLPLSKTHFPLRIPAAFPAAIHNHPLAFIPAIFPDSAPPVQPLLPAAAKPRHPPRRDTCFYLLGPKNRLPFRWIMWSGISAIQTSVSQAKAAENFL